jgi:hypothetical protein
MLFEVALTQRPTKKEEEEGKGETLVMPPRPVVADTDQAAAIKAVTEFKADGKNGEINLDRVKVYCRPFCE